MSGVYIRLDRAAVAQFLKSEEVAALVARQCDRVRDAVQDSAGTWSVSPQLIHKNRIVGEVGTSDERAHWSEAESGRIAAIVKGMRA